ncbi:MAG: carboxypeptidase-like regulatory domain-containing protein [Candidatus Eremiobacteraeota bacterium]|nr:carboxypeptidase-like regulatory domain-containing protein [Candidatus Eremiobacteraeota bacterium]
MKRTIFALLIYAAFTGMSAAQPPAPLVVGVVRDRSGSAVADARVSALDAAGRALAATRTAEDGAFALAAPGATLIRIACKYCRAAQYRLTAGQPLIVFVQRFDALLHDGPSARDADELPYAHIESALSLTPYAVFADSSGLLAGPVVSDRGLSRAGGLVVDRGVPNYDFAAGVSPFLTEPSRSTNEFTAAGAGSALRYGDRADAGTSAIERPRTRPSALFAGGSDTIGRVDGGSQFATFDASASNNAIERRARADAGVSFPIADGSVQATVSAARGRLSPHENESLDAAFTAARISGQMVRAHRWYGDVVLDRGSYGGALPSAVGAQWADESVHAGVATLGDTNAFLEVGARHSNGTYVALPFVDTIRGAVSQMQLTAGVQSHSAASDVVAGFSAVDVAYLGGPTDPEYVPSTRAAGALVFAPSIDYTFRSGDRWSIDILTASTFRLPALLERYARPPVENVLLLNRNSLAQVAIAYTDLARMRASVTAYRQSTRGLDTGTVSGVGAALAWQIAPQLSVRTWMLHVIDTTSPQRSVLRLTPSQIDAIVGSGWLTYDSGWFRADAIYRRDILDAGTVSHVDYSVSSALTTRLDWFVGSEVRHGERFTDVGIRIARP